MNIELSNEESTPRVQLAERQQENQKSGFYAALVFLVWPLLAVFLAFKDSHSSWAKNILWAFVAFYGSSFAIGVENQESDIVRYVDEVEYLHSIPMTFNDAVNYYSQGNDIDVAQTIISIVVSRFTDNQVVLTFVYGLFFGFFFSRNIWFVLDRIEGRLRPEIILLIVCFFLVVPFWNITTFRMWTAAHVFAYGALPFLFEGKWSGAFIASLSILVHYTFMIPVGMLYLFALLGNRLNIYFIFFIATLFIAEINLESFNNIVETYAPESIQERSSGYRGEQYVENFRDNSNTGQVWYAVWYGRVLKWSIMGFLILLFIKGRDFFNSNKHWGSLMSFTLLFYSVANLLSSLPSGGRFIAVANLCALPLIILYIQNKEQDIFMNRFVLAATPALFLFVIVSLRIGLYSMSATFLLGNPLISLLFNDEHISLNDVLRMIV